MYSFSFSFLFFVLVLGQAVIVAACIGLKRNPANGIVSWSFSCRNGASYPQPDKYSIYYLSSHVGHWYRVEIHLKMGVTNGKLRRGSKVHYIGRTGYRNTAYYGGLNHVQFGLPQLYSRTFTTA